MKALLLDVGNSRIKWGVLDGGDIRRTGHISQDRIRDKGLQVLTTKLPRRVDEVFVSNVAGNSFATRLSGVVGMHCGCDVRFARVEKRGWGLSNSYTQPRRMGVDRWVAMVGAWAEIQDTCLVVDVGTALTLDAIDDSGAHLGGQIIPGVAAMTTALSSATSDIPVVRPLPARKGAEMQMFAQNTAAAVREGARNAVVGAVDRAIQTLQSNGYLPATILTGGDASRILEALSEAPVHRPHLVLQGLAHMLESDQ
ncbi:MAG: type III pantothenate kinase [Gammaproteobacteria bacterium]|nr:type III pantothenate kinase [Gammaproteobacteria bacterium]MBT8111236.1 type III pantothenate kinase [Gammaproteobacteria bacterium]NND47641.1 type III pantothenate kinase [Woeseiaceae bacterium]NNL45934.1 type III pantothenate kinase [Woeseiaceae bacterium]